MIQREAVWHQPYGAYCYPVGERELLVTLRARKGNLKSCSVLFGDRYLSWDMKSRVTTLEMARAESDELFDYFQATLELDTRRFRYLFHLDDGREQLWYGPRGFASDKGRAGTFETFFHNIAALPRLNTKNPEVQKYCIDVARHWLNEVGIDGWRLDVANEVDHWFWRAFREAVKAVKPDALLVGEILHDATEFLRGDEWDSVMNYLFRGLAVDFFARREIGAAKFDQALAGFRVKYPRQAQYVLWNLIGSHDTERFLTLCNGDVDALKLAATFQMTYVGAPVIYYGDEVGMEGGPDPDCRRPMLWEEGLQNGDLLAYYKKLIGARREISALRRGIYRTVVADDELGVFGFERRDGSSAAGGDCRVFLPRKSAAMFTSR